ncbi:hypothetical protein [Cognatishimia sp. MH4019]|uniref:SEL1-like repeat protein n=1 Tax=Cognatishimia sp. MH4019 TaxID=2854030 RepID=UPI001CD53104|nr:hypothetical protein [Cognatishimia sp. MH4019]
MKYAVIATVLMLALAGPGIAQDHRALFKDIGGQEQSDPKASFDAMLSLAESGYAPAVDRVGYYFRHGIGTEQNLETARQWYKRAVAAGHPWSTASLARVEIELDRGDAAFHLLRTAVRENRPGTHRLLATAHIDRQLGPASDPALGREILENLAIEGDRNAARDLAVRINWGRLSGRVSDAALAQIVQAGREGDVRFAEVALVYLSRQNDKSAATIEARAHLANIPGMRDRVLSVERIRLAADKEPRHFWSRVEEVLAETETENYARAASTAFWINKNAWVRVLQKELRGLGYYTGKINGRMTHATIRAQNRFCKDAEIWSICATGPLRGPTVKAVADAIANYSKDT